MNNKWQPFLDTRIHIASFMSHHHLQKYIDEKVGPDEKLPWVQSVLTKGFTGEVCPSCLAKTKIKEIKEKVLYFKMIQLFKVRCITLIY